MANDPRISVSADLSSFEQEINKLKTTISQLGEKLKTETGKTDLNFSGPQKQLEALIKNVDKMTAALDKGNKSSSQYAKNLKAAQEAMAAAAKMAAKLEAAGGAKTSKVSGYFNEFSSELAQERAEFLANHDREKEREAEKAIAAKSARERNNRWAGSAAKFAGFAGGAIMGGGGAYGTLGAFVGSRMPGPLGMVGGAIGGMVGGAADRFIQPARDEAKIYSELRRMVGSTTTDFEELRDSVRSVTYGLGVTNNEAANLSKQFAHTAGLVGDATEAAKSVGTSAGFAQGYGMSPEIVASFFAQMRLAGSANNDKDNRRLALMIGESVQRGGTSAKMDEVLTAISGFAARSSQQMMTAPDVGQYSSYLASLNGSSYAGLKSNPNNAAQLMNMMDAGVSSGGTMGEASQYHWLQARQSAFPGMSAMDNSLMQTAGATGDLTKLFSPNSPAYDNASPEARAQMDKTRKSIEESGYRNNFQVGMAHIKAISGGDSYMENANFRGMFGGNPQQAAALMQRMQNDPGLGKFEKELGKYGIGLDNVNVAQISAMSQLMHGGEGAMADQFEKLVGSGKLSKAELDSADKVMSRSGYGEDFKKLLLNLTAKYDVDDGQKSQTTLIDINNKIQEKVSSLVNVESDSREYLLRLLDRFGAAGPVFDRFLHEFKGDDQLSGKDASGGDYNGKSWIDKGVMASVNNSLKEMAMAPNQEEKDRLYTDLMEGVKANPQAYPAEVFKWAKKARGGSDTNENPKEKPAETTEPTIPGEVPPTRVPGYPELSKQQHDIVGKTLAPSKFDPMFLDIGKDVGLDPLVIKQLAATESGINPNATNHNKNGTDDLGMMQHNSRFAGGRGLRGDDWRDPYKNTLAGARFFKKLLDGSNGDMRSALKRYNGAGPAAERYADMGMGIYDAVHADKRKDSAIPDSDKMPSSVQNGEKVASTNMQFKHVIDVHLRDQAGKRLADPVSISTRLGAPKAAGVN